MQEHLNSSTQLIPQVLNRIKIRRACWPLHPRDRLLMQESIHEVILVCMTDPMQSWKFMVQWRRTKYMNRRPYIRRMTVVHKLTFSTKRHETHMLFTGQPRYANWVMHRWPQSMYASLESPGMKTRRWKCISWLIVMKCSAMPISHLRYPLPVILLKP